MECTLRMLRLHVGGRPRHFAPSERLLAQLPVDQERVSFHFLSAHLISRIRFITIWFACDIHTHIYVMYIHKLTHKRISDSENLKRENRFVLYHFHLICVCICFLFCSIKLAFYTHWLTGEMMHDTRAFGLLMARSPYFLDRVSEWMMPTTKHRAKRRRRFVMAAPFLLIYIHTRHEQSFSSCSLQKKSMYIVYSSYIYIQYTHKHIYTFNETVFGATPRQGIKNSLCMCKLLNMHVLRWMVGVVQRDNQDARMLVLYTAAAAPQAKGRCANEHQSIF